MGWFGKSNNDTKSRIEELKKKIQAEQQSISAPAAPAPAAPVSPPPVAAPVVVTPPPQPQPVVIEQRPMETVEERPRARPLDRVLDRMEHPSSRHEMHRRMEQDNGVVLDIGEGMSLNLPIRSRMHMDEFFAVVERVRELQRIERR